MSDLKLFQIGDDDVREIPGTSVAIEKSLQDLIEQNLEALLSIRFLASEYKTEKSYGARIDTLGIDENNQPVIIEYKRSLSQNVINQGLFYLNWLLDHKADLLWLVNEKHGKEAANAIEWSTPRLLCIAADFTRYDEHAIKQIPQSIELIRYRRYGSDLLLFELVNATTAGPQSPTVVNSAPSVKKIGQSSTILEKLEKADSQLRNRYETLRAYMETLGDDVQVNSLQNYFAFKRLKNFACVEIHPNLHRITVWVKVDPGSVDIENGFTKDMRGIGHYGTGDLEIRIDDDYALEKAKPLIERSYEAS